MPRAARSGNPYQFGSPIDDAVHLADRRRELEKLRGLMLNGQNALLIAPRRFGKTSLLNRAMAEVEDAGGRTGRVNLIRCATPQDVAEEILLAVVRGPLGWLRGHLEETVRYLRHLRVTPELTIDPQTGSIRGVRLSGVESREGWQQLISDIIRTLRPIAGDARHPVSFVLDEFQKVLQIDPGMPDVFKALVDELATVSLVFSGSIRHLMEAMANDPDHGALYNVGAKLYLDKVPEPDFVGYLVARAASAGAALSMGQAERIYELAGGVPNDVQLLAFFSFEEAQRQVIDEAAIDRAVAGAVGDQKNEFERLFSELSRSQQGLLRQLANGDLPSLTSQPVVSRLGISVTGAAKAERGLEQKDLIVRGPGGWTLASGLLRLWLRGAAQ